MQITMVYVDYVMVYDGIFVFKVSMKFACASFTVYIFHNHNDPTPPTPIKEISKWISELMKMNQNDFF